VSDDAEDKEEGDETKEEKAVENNDNTKTDQASSEKKLPFAATTVRDSCYLLSLKDYYT
jgi:hypothetical protein